MSDPSRAAFERYIVKLGCLSGVALVDSGRGEVDDRIVYRHAG